LDVSYFAKCFDSFTESSSGFVKLKAIYSKIHDSTSEISPFVTITKTVTVSGGPVSSVGIATHYGLRGPGIEWMFRIVMRSDLRKQLYALGYVETTFVFCTKGK
jgi:hypothetical protein